MEKTILIAGKDYPDGRDLASAVVLRGDTAVITTNPVSAELITDDSSVPVVWNRTSVLSARSLVLSCLNQKGRLDEAVLVFDEEYYAPKYGNPGATENTRALDELILGYQYLTSELLLRFDQRKLAGLDSKPGKIVFLYRSNFSEADAIHNPALRSSAKTLSKALVSAAGAAFKAFAQNIAASGAETNDFIPVLVECNSDNETAKTDGSLMSWLCDYLDQIDQLKKGLSAKQKISWVKAGTKSPGGFNLFK